MKAGPGTDTDVVIIGCGAGGSTAATILARAGRRVLVLEKEVFPRFHVGESLLPYNRPLFDDLGVWTKLKAAGFPAKFGAQFHLANGRKSHRFVFRQGRFTAHHDIIQVERARFDHLLMQHAREMGADVREGWTVRRFHRDTQGVSVEATDPSRQPQALRARFLIDASGRSNLTGNQEGLREVHQEHRKFSVFGHFTGVRRDAGEPGGDTVIVRFRHRWFWLIPVSADRTSVGLVLDRSDLEREGGDPEAAFQRAVRASAVMRERLADARPLGPLQTTADFSYFNRRLVGPRLVRVGDAAGFMDPIFSAGVFLAMWSGRLAAHAVNDALEHNRGESPRFMAYEQRITRAQRLYWRLVEGYYQRPFIELFLEPRHSLDLPAAVVAVLAGDLEPPWRIRWRLRFFYLLVWIQGRRPLVPRITSFSDEDDEEMATRSQGKAARVETTA